MIAAYREKDRPKARSSYGPSQTSFSTGVPAALTELLTLARTLKLPADDVMACFDRRGTSSGPTEAIKCRHRHLIAYADVWVMPIQ